MQTEIVLALVAFVLSVFLLFATYRFFRAFKDSSLAQPLMIIDFGLFAMAIYCALQLFEKMGIAGLKEYSQTLQIVAYVLLLTGLFVGWSGFKHFEWLKEVSKK